jgi:hypothetical protein
VILLSQNITNIDIVIITKQKHILGSKADKSLKAYKSRRRKKKFLHTLDKLGQLVNQTGKLILIRNE